jgi:guanine deaminase
MFNEGLIAYHRQMLSPDHVAPGPAHLLGPATSAGAVALGLADEVGDLSADFVLVGSTLHTVVERSESVEAKVGALFTLAREESIAEVRVAGRAVLSGAGA